VGHRPSGRCRAITSFMLVAHGSAVPDGGVTAANAAGVEIAPK
jgi:hypothetical protein